MRIKIDVDGVLRNVSPMMIKLYNEKFHTNITINDVKHFDIDKSFPLLKANDIDGFKYFFEENAEVVFGKSPMYECANIACQRLIDAGHKVTIVTHQTTTQNKILTLEWIDEHQIPYDSIAFTRKKYNISGDVLIDDNANWLENEADSTRKICITTPYNIHFTGERYNSIVEAVDALLK